MSHLNYQKQISLLQDGELNESSARDLLAHLTECPNCMRVYEDMASLNSTLATVKLSLPDGSLARKVKAGIAGGEQAVEYRWKFTLLKQVPVWALIAILAVGVGNMAGKTLTEALNGQDSAQKLESLLQDNGESFADVVLDLGQGENSQ